MGEGRLVSGAWNYPVQLILLLLIGAVAAGMWSGSGVGGDYGHGGDECGCRGGGKGWAKGGWCLGPGTIQYSSSFCCSAGLSLLVCDVVVVVVVLVVTMMVAVAVVAMVVMVMIENEKKWAGR